MVDTDQNTNHPDEDIHGENASQKDRAFWKQALSEAVKAEARNMEEENEDMALPPLSKRHRIQMNRLFREQVGNTFLPYPEVDSLYERMRSKLIIRRNKWR
jgi:hypothetical protein